MNRLTRHARREGARISRVTIPRMRRLALRLLVVLAAGAVSAQGPAAHRLGGGGCRDPQTFHRDRPDRLDRPAHDAARRREAGRGLPPQRARAGGHSHRDLRPRAEPPQPGCPPEGRREEASAAAHGAHRHGERRPEEVDASALQRAAPGRLHLRPRHGRRQGQRRRHGDGAADAEAPERAARPRRHRPLRGRRRRRGALRHRAHGRRCPLPEHRGRVLPGRGRQLQPPGRQGHLRVNSDAREDPARHHLDGTRHGRPRLGAAAQRTRSSSSRRPSQRWPKWKPPIRLQRDDRGLLQAARDHLRPGRGRPLPRHPRAPIRRCRTPPTSTSSTTSRGTPPPSAPRSRRR